MDHPNKKLMKQAADEARRVNHEYVGTEHVLLALMKDEASAAATVLKHLDVNPDEVQRRIEAIVQPGLSPSPAGRLPFTPRVKQAIEYAVEEARGMGHKRTGSDHLLLGLMREEECIAAQVLQQAGVRCGAVRREVQKLRQGESAP